MRNIIISPAPDPIDCIPILEKTVYLLHIKSISQAYTQRNFRLFNLFYYFFLVGMHSMINCGIFKILNHAHWTAIYQICHF